MIISGNSKSKWVPVVLGVPQGSVLGPLLFILFTADITSFIPCHSATGHLFADDVRAYVHGPPSAQLILAGCVEALSNDLHLWMSSNRLSLNFSKTQLIWFGTPQQLRKLDFLLLAEKFPSLLNSSTSVRDLGVTLDSSLTFSEHISNLTRSSYFKLRRLRAIRSSVSSSTLTSIVHAFVSSRIDYCNSLLIGLPKVRLSPIQSVLNAAARLIACLPKFSHISNYMVNELHWLPLSARIQFKVLVLVLKSTGPCLQSTSGTTSISLSQQLQIDLSALLTCMFSLFRVLGLLWPKLGLLPPLGPPCGMPSLFYVLLFFQDPIAQLSLSPQNLLLLSGLSHWKRY